jgi:putative copper resistance protein D
VITLLALTRAVHLAALALLVGAFAFLLLVARPSFRRTSADLRAERAALDRAVMRLATGSLLIAIVTALGWLWIQAALVTGRSLGEVVAADALLSVLTGTQFGRVQQVRFGLLAILGAFLLLRGRESDDRDWVALRLEGAILGGAVLAALSWVGHAGATGGRQGVIHLLANSLHLLAAGVWLGGLLPLVMLLGTASTVSPSPLASVIPEAVRRFSALGLVSVGTLVLTGLVNSWVLVGSFPALVGTPYGQLLLLKLVLLLPLIAIAAVNRVRLKPRLLASRVARPDGPARPLVARLRRNAIGEAGLGAVVFVVVGLLGVTPPAWHVSPSWPFTVRFSWDANKDRPELLPAMIVASAAAALGMMAIAYGLARWRHRAWAIAIGLVAIGYSGLTPFRYLAVDAYPTTYLRPSVPYSALAVANGARLYSEHCAVCHGVGGYGDGPAARGLSTAPANLTAQHTADHTAGDLFWWLTHGIRGSPMPGFKDRLGEEDRWDLINFLRALAAAEQARWMGPVVESRPWLVGPDFTFGIGVGTAETLKSHRGWAMVHLVLFTLPGSLPRLEAIDRAWTRIGYAGARVLAVPMRDSDLVYRVLGARAANLPMVVDGSPEIAASYALFRRTPMSPDVPPTPPHMEFLIDRQGYVRARWIPGQDPGWDDVSRLLAEIERLGREPPGASAPEEHVH